MLQTSNMVALDVQPTDLELLSVRVEFVGSKIAITTANFGGLNFFFTRLQRLSSDL